MKMKKKLNMSINWQSIVLLFLVTSVSTFFSCDSGDDDGNDISKTPTAVITVSAATIGPGETVTASSTDSENAEDFTRIWEISGSGKAMINDVNHDFSSGQATISGVESISIIPEVTGSLFVNLRLENSGEFTSTSTSITVSGAVRLSVVPEGYEFVDVNPGGGDADYILTGDVEIGNATTAEGSTIVFGIDADATIRINGNLNSRSSSINFQTSEGPAWKGLVVETGGSITHSDGTAIVYVVNAGSAGIGIVDPASVVVDNASNSNMYFYVADGSGYDIVFTETVTSIENVRLAAGENGIHGPSTLWPSLELVRSFGPTNLTMASDVNVQMAYQDNNVTVYGTVEFEGGFSYGGRLTIQSVNNLAKILMPENSSFITGGLLVTNTTEFDGVDGASWAGIYLGSADVSVLTSLTVKNAGGNFIVSNSITGVTQKAAIYCDGNLNRLVASDISSAADAYGLYMSSTSSMEAPGLGSGPIRATNFSSGLAAISLDQKHGGYIADSNTFDLNGDVAAVEVRQSSTEPSHLYAWQGLGSGNFYEFTGNLTMTSNALTLDEGVHLKFRDDKGLYYSGPKLTISGTSVNPVTIEGSGDWLGMMVGNNTSTNFIADYLIVDGGGHGVMTGIGVTQAANLVINTSLNNPSTSQFSVTNSTMSNTAGYGIYVTGTNAFWYDFLDPSFGNAPGDVDDQGDCDNDGTPNNGEFPGCECDNQC